MSKVKVSDVAEVLKKHQADPVLLRAVVEELNAQAKNDEGEEKAPPQKKQFVIIISDPEGKLPKKDLTGWVVQIPEDASPFSTLDRVFKGSYDFNATKKGRLLPVKSVGDALESGSAKLFKEAELWVKTKLPCGVVVTDNVLPKDEFVTEKVDHRRKDE